MFVIPLCLTVFDTRAFIGFTYILIIEQLKKTQNLYLETFMEPRSRIRANRFRHAAYVAWRAGTTKRVDVFVPPGWESIPGLLNRD